MKKKEYYIVVSYYKSDFDDCQKIKPEDIVEQYGCLADIAETDRSVAEQKAKKLQEGTENIEVEIWTVTRREIFRFPKAAKKVWEEIE